MSRVKRWLRLHRRDEEAAAEAVGLTLVWQLLCGIGVFGAGYACAAVLTTSTYHPGFSLSVKGAAFITRNEGVRYQPYNDPSGIAACTVGVGHVLDWRMCTSAQLRSTFTVGQVSALLMHDSSGAASCVRQAVTRPISQPQFDALVDLTFNAGCGSLDYRGVRGSINAGDLAAVPGELADTAVTAGGVYLAGLRTRRLAEGALFARGYYGAGIGYYLPPKPPKPLTPAQKKVKALKARTGYFNWLQWELGEGAWASYRPHVASVRPHVPAHISKAWWKRERAFVKARK